MRLPGTPHECGPLFEYRWISRQLDLAAPIVEGVETIPVAQIVGSVSRARDFDACWHPLHSRLATTLREIEASGTPGLDEPIDVIRVDRAYFVVDGHKRTALARARGQEFIDANVSHSTSRYAVSPHLDEDAILRTARESEFRRHSGFAEALPDVRFALTEMDTYGELYAAVQVHAFEMAERAGGIVAWPDVARDWHTSVYRPTVEAARSNIGALIGSMTDADIFLAIHRRRLAWWGSECDSVDCAAQELLVEQQLDAARRGPLQALLARDRSEAGQRAALLPLRDATPSAPDGSTDLPIREARETPRRSQ
jgi:hypothetical protein